LNENATFIYSLHDLKDDGNIGQELRKGYVFMDAEGKIYNFFNTGKKSPIPEIGINHAQMIEKYGFKPS
jgi:hypothetical protein